MTATADAPADLHEHRYERRRRSRAKRWGAAVLLLAVGCAAVWAVWFSSLLAVTRVRVVGAVTVPASAVIAAAAVPAGTPLARVDVAAVTARVQALPRIASVEVRRGFPHELVLAVVERVAVAVVPTASGMDVVDGTGVRFAHQPRASGLPVLVVKDDGGLRAGLDVLAALPAGVRHDVVSVAAGSRDDVTLTLSSGARVQWGDATRSADKARVLTALLTRPAKQYDVSAPDLPTTSN